MVGESAPVAINASFTSTDSFILRQECTVVPRFGVLSLLRVRYLWYPPTVSHVIHYYDRNGHLYVGLSSLVQRCFLGWRRYMYRATLWCVCVQYVEEKRNRQLQGEECWLSWDGL